MTRFIFLLVLLATVFTAAAQSENSIIIDQNTFRPIQSDAITGVAIDKIGMDSSRRPCARIKVKINRMSKDDINKIEIKIHSNNELTKYKTAEYDNGLIIEMTAKSATRFYFYHPEFGYSNEVTLNLEANKEYYIEASLNQTFSIIVDSNIAGAEVYLDNVFKSTTDSNFRSTIKGVLVGNHTLKVVYGKIAHEQNIEVNSGNISFRQNVNTAATESQFVVFIVEPSNAIVMINNQPYALQDGAMQVVLEPGTYNYTVTAAGYHSQSGTFVVAGNKVEKPIKLTADTASVTITAPNNAEIWINGTKRGNGTWRGILNSGNYIFEARKEGHKSSKISQNITSQSANQSYALPAPTPIYGSLVVSGTPIAAEVILDGKSVGSMPLKLSEVLIGSHTLTISKSGYKTNNQAITISEGKTTNINTTLTQLTTSTPKHTNIKNKNAKVAKVKNHFESNIDLNYSMHAQPGSMINHIGLNYIGGLRTNKIFVGLGIGAEYNIDNIDNSAHIGNASQNFSNHSSGGTMMSSGTISVPIYAHFRTYMGSRNCIFVSLSAGGKLFGSNSFTYDEYTFKYNTNGAFADLGVGLQFGKFYVSASATTQTIPCAEFITEKQIDLKSKLGFGAKISTGFTF